MSSGNIGINFLVMKKRHLKIFITIILSVVGDISIYFSENIFTFTAGFIVYSLFIDVIKCKLKFNCKVSD